MTRRAAALGAAALLSGVGLAWADAPEILRVEPVRPELAFATPRPDLGGLKGLDAQVGGALFDRLWVAAPASTRAADGLGPLYNARACSACHRNHGRGHPPEGVGPAPASLVIRLAGAGGASDPALGRQIQPRAVGGMAGEAQPHLAWREETRALPDGAAVTLRRPVMRLREVATGAPHAATALGVRIAPPLVALGAVAAIDAADIIAGADPDDRDGDGVRGRARMIPDASVGEPVLGRFGRKAGSPGLEASVAVALALDMGLSSPSHSDPWGDCTPAQVACRAAPHGDGDARVHEVSAQGVGLIAQHLASLAPPARRDLAAPETQRGEALFAAVGCAACHRPSFVIGEGAEAREIRPYSDFLLHDLGPDLADAAPEAGVAAGEWRTAPLWGIGRTRDVGEGRESYLHDGRARTLFEAILWHGGSAAPARDRAAALSPDDRAALLRFLESL